MIIQSDEISMILPLVGYIYMAHLKIDLAVPQTKHPQTQEDQISSHINTNNVQQVEGPAEHHF